MRPPYRCALPFIGLPLKYVAACAAASTALVILPSFAHGETPLDAYRRALQARDFETVGVWGSLSRFETRNAAILSLSMRDLQQIGVHSLTLVDVTVGAHKLRARVLPLPAYQATLKKDASSGLDADADSFIVFDPADPNQPVRLIGRGESLREALSVSDGERVGISQTRVRATPAANIKSGG